MQLEILFFGITADIVGKKSIKLEISKDSTIEDLRKQLSNDYPKLIDYKSFSVAVNMEYAEGNTILKNGDIVALIPPVSGG